MSRLYSRLPPLENPYAIGRQKIRRDNRSRIREKIELEEQALVSTDMQVTEFMSVSELASLLNVKPAQVIMTCMNLGVIVSINQRLDAEIIEHKNLLAYRSVAREYRTKIDVLKWHYSYFLLE